MCPIECVILLYMLDLCRNGVYRKISIMEVYNIMECYDKCSDLINDFHLNNFTLCGQYELISNNINNSVCYIFTPQFNKLNMYGILFEGLFRSYIIVNTESEESTKRNKDRFFGKKNYVCIFTLEYDSPILINYDLDQDKECSDIITKEIKRVLFEKYSKEHVRFYELYTVYHKKMSHYKTIKKMNNSISKLGKIPYYITCFFKDLEVNYKQNQKETTKILNNEREFLSKLNEKLISVIENFFSMSGT